MLHICTSVLDGLDLRLNIKKSVAMRIGPRFDKVCIPLIADGQQLHVVQSVKYLGIHMKSGRSWRLCLRSVRSTFYRTFNAILSKCKSAVSELTSVHLLNTICVPILTYALEACALSRSDFLTLDGMIDNALRKIFGVSERSSLQIIRDAVGFTSMRDRVNIAKCKFIASMVDSTSSVSRCIRPLASRECFIMLSGSGADSLVVESVHYRSFIRCYR